MGAGQLNVQQNVAVAFKSRYVKLQLWVSDSLCFLSRVPSPSPQSDCVCAIKCISQAKLAILAADQLGQ